MKRAGKKYTSTHTTVIEAATPLVDFANAHVCVDKIVLGLIKSLPNSRGGTIKRVKCTQESACLFVKIRGNRAIQEVRFFSKNVQQFEKEFKKYAKTIGFEIS